MNRSVPGTVEQVVQVVQEKHPLIIAHRGDSFHAPENTVAAFRMALEKGADGLEFDIQLAKDDVPVIFHDTTLRRTAGRNGTVTDLTSRELSGIDVGSWFNRRSPKLARPQYARETVPTLEEVLETLHDQAGLIYVELKCRETNYKPLAEAVCDLIRSSAMFPRIIVMSFCLAAIAEVRLSLPEVRTAALFEPSILTVLRRRSHFVALARDFGADQMSVHTSLAAPKLVSLATEAGMPVTVWTSDAPRWIGRCRKRGIGALITNDPARLIAARAA